MALVLNQYQKIKHLTDVHQLEVTNRLINPDNDHNPYTILLSDHKPGSFTVGLDIHMGYLYITNSGPSSIDFRLNKEQVLGHVQKNRKVALMVGDCITLFIPYIGHDEQSKSNQLKICLETDLSLLFELI